MPDAAVHTRGETTGFRTHALACTRDFDATARIWGEFVHPRKLKAGVLRERASCGRSRLVCTSTAVEKEMTWPACLQSCNIESTAPCITPGNTLHFALHTRAFLESCPSFCNTPESNLRDHANWARVCTRYREPLHTPWESLQPSEN